MTRVRDIFTVAALCGGLLVVAPGAAAASYEIDGVHSGVVFKVNHLGFSNFYGRFNEIAGTFDFDTEAPDTASFDVTIKAESVDTHSERRDTHLRSPDFFNAKQFPVITLKSKSVKKTGDSTYQAKAELNLRGVKKEITVDITHVGSGEHPRFGVRAGFETTFAVNRSDFGMNYMPEGLGDSVELTVFIEGSRK